MTKRIYGWKHQKKDSRDYKFSNLRCLRALVASLPSSMDLRQWDSPIEDQGELGSCTANSLTGILQFNEVKYASSGSVYQNLSRLFIYYNERALEGSVDQDSGAEIRDGIKTLATYGVCNETVWPYNVDQFTIKPSAQCYTSALPDVIHSYYSLDAATPAQTLINIKTAIASGEPVSFGFDVYDSFESDTVAQTGIMSIPDTTTESIQGGHAVVFVGYDDAKQWFIVRNSWGTNWGDKGYFYMPYAVVLNGMASDFWVVIKEV